jgi:transposase
MSKEKYDFLKSINSFHSQSEKVKNDFFCNSNFFDSKDKAQVKYEMIRYYSVNKMTVTKVCAEFGFSREAFYTLYKEFQKKGFNAFINERTGRKTKSKITLEISGYIIKLKSTDNKLSSAKIAKQIKQHFNVNINKKTVERTLKEYGFGLKKNKYRFKE